jgi:hypothetical protein
MAQGVDEDVPDWPIPARRTDRVPPGQRLVVVVRPAGRALIKAATERNGHWVGRV